MKKESYQQLINDIASQIQFDYPDRESYYDICEDMARTFDKQDEVILYLKSIDVQDPYSRIASDLLNELIKKGVTI